jgi:hypothetical protein
VAVLDIITAGESGEVSSLVGDQTAHPRVIPDYPPNKWDVAVKDSWQDGEEAAATKKKNDIIKYNEKNGGLIASPKKKVLSFKEKIVAGFPKFLKKTN